MARFCCILVICLAPASVRAQAESKHLLDLWDAAYLQGTKSGHVHTFAQEVEIEGMKLIKTTVELRLTVRRFNETIQLGMDTGTVESQEGKVLAVFMKQYLGKTKQREITGVVQGNQLKLTLDQNTPMKPAPWD